MKQKQDDVNVTIDFDRALETWNEKNPKKRKITREDVIKEGITRGTIHNYKTGNVPKSILSIFRFLNRTNLKINDLIKVTDKDGKRIL